MLPLLVSIALLASSVFAQNVSYLTVTAMVTNNQNHSALECWKLSTPLASSSEAGISGSLGFKFNATKVNFAILPPKFNGGRHNAPVPQLVAFTSGLAHISLPYPVTGNVSQDEAWIVGGSSGLLIASDTEGEGHITYPSGHSTPSLAVPFAGGVIPEHEVLSFGPCHYDSMVGQVITS